MCRLEFAGGTARSERPRLSLGRFPSLSIRGSKVLLRPRDTARRGSWRPYRPVRLCLQRSVANGLAHKERGKHVRQCLKIETTHAPRHRSRLTDQRLPVTTSDTHLLLSASLSLSKFSFAVAAAAQHPHVHILYRIARDMDLTVTAPNTSPLRGRSTCAGKGMQMGIGPMGEPSAD